MRSIKPVLHCQSIVSVLSWVTPVSGSQSQDLVHSPGLRLREGGAVSILLLHCACTLCSLRVSVAAAEMTPWKGPWMVGGWNVGSLRALRQSTKSRSRTNVSDGSSTVMSWVEGSEHKSLQISCSSSAVRTREKISSPYRQWVWLTSVAPPLVMRQYQELTNSWSLAIRVAVEEID